MNVTISPSSRGVTWRMAFPYDRELVAATKALPQASRRFDKRAGYWRISTSHVREVIETAQRAGHVVLLDGIVVALGEAHGGRLVVERCPFCRHPHTHGSSPDGPAVEHRVAHCAGQPGPATRTYSILVRRAARQAA